MATTVAGSPTFFSLPYHEGPTTLHGVRIGVNTDTGAVQSTCPVSVGSKSEAEGGTVFTLDDGRMIFTIGHGLQTTITAAGITTSTINYDALSGDLASSFEQVMGSNHVDEFYVTGEYILPDSAPFQIYLTVTPVNPDTGAATNPQVAYISAFSSMSGAVEELSALCVDADGVLHFISGDNKDDYMAATHTWKRFDIAAGMLLGDLTSFPPGAVFPRIAFAQRDGKILALCSDADGAGDTITLFSNITGAGLTGFATPSDAFIFCAGPDDTYFLAAFPVGDITTVQKIYIDGSPTVELDVTGIFPYTVNCLYANMVPFSCATPFIPTHPTGDGCVVNLPSE